MTYKLQQSVLNLPKVERDFDFGPDIIDAQGGIFNADNNDTIEFKFRVWISRKQPCIFGKPAGAKRANLDFHLTVVTEKQLFGSTIELADYLHKERKYFKNLAADGLCSAHLIFFVSQALAFAAPSVEFARLQATLCELQFPECRPVLADRIYTEAVPLKRLSGLEIYKAGINTFYPTAHLTRNHDRRIPGGFLISVNAPGHYLALGLDTGMFQDLESGLSQIKILTMNSVGAGGISHPQKISTTWHRRNAVDRKGRPCENSESAYYSGFYHTDVLIPSNVTLDANQIHSVLNDDPCIFKWNVLFYVTMESFSPGHPYFGEFIGIPIDPEAIYFNPALQGCQIVDQFHESVFDGPRTGDSGSPDVGHCYHPQQDYA